MDRGDAAVLTFLIGILVGALMAGWVLGAFHSPPPCEEGRVMLEEAGIRIMIEDRIGTLEGGVCRFATDEGFVLYHDGQLYFEAGE